ncbi:MAG TPA: hypothetical protein VGL51_16510 [Solirubrobacteraceae bacterium]|jgi:hypothetical protein
MAPRFNRVLAVLASTMIVGGVLATAPALGATSPAITDCVAHAELTKHYSLRELRRALNTMSASTREYTDCSDVLNRALAADISNPGGGGTGSSGSGSFLPIPVIIVLVVLILAAIGFGVLAVRRRSSGTEGAGGGGEGP